MKISLTSILSIFCFSPICIVLVQAILNRVCKNQNPQKLAVTSIIFAFPIFHIFAYFLTSSLHSYYIAYISLLYWFSAYTYFHLFNMSETARRIRLILMVGGKKSNQEPKPIFNAQEMIEVRLRRLASLNQIANKNGAYVRTGYTLYFAATLIYGLSKVLGRPWPEITNHSFSDLDNGWKAFDKKNNILMRSLSIA